MLWKKMLRDLKENKGAYIACMVVIIIGLMMFSSFSMVINNLKQSQQDFYLKQNFADGFAKVQAAPLEKVKELKNIEGIKDIQGRIVHDVRVISEDKKENVYLRLVSLDLESNNIINGVRVTRGISLDNKKMNIWIDNKFFEANSLSLNDEIKIIVDGKEKSLQLVGVGMSPEFIYALRTGNDIYPDPQTFGIAFVPLEVMQSLFPGNGIVNDVVFTLEPGAKYEDVEELLEHELKPYGLEEIFSRKDQTSHMLLSEELKGLESMARAMPFVFLSIAGIILYIMLKRMTEQQRGQIGILKAFGYTSQEIIMHYMSYAVFIGVAGGILGGLLGITLSGPFTSLYQEFFNMPGLGSSFSPLYLMLSVLIALCFALLAGYQGCKGILKLEPAQAMRPQAPMAGKKTSIEKITFFWNMLTTQGKMSMRNIARNKGRSVFIFLGIALSFAVLTFTWSMNDMMQIMLFDQYEKVETYDVKVSFSKPLDQEKTLRELSRFPGVNKVEPLAEVPVTLKNNWLKKDVVILGLSGDGSMYNILDKNNRKVKPPSSGLYLSERLAQLLDAEVGTRLNVESLMLNNPDNEDKQLEVTGIIPQYLGINAYMEINALQEFLGEKGLATSLMLGMNKESIPLLQDEYRQSELVSSIEDQGARLEQSQELMASYGSMIYIFALIGIIISFAIIYNSSIVSLSERSHELASMRVLGMTPSEVLSVVTFEQWFTAFLAVLAGIPLSKMLSVGMSQAISNDVYTMPTTITVSSFLIAFLVTAASIWAAQQVAAKRINQLSLADTLKLRE